MTTNSNSYQIRKFEKELWWDVLKDWPIIKHQPRHDPYGLDKLGLITHNWLGIKTFVLSI